MLLRVSLFCSQFRAARGKMRIIILALSTILLLASCLNRSADVLQRGDSVGGASDEQPQKILTESKDLAKLLDSASAKEAFADYLRRLKQVPIPYTQENLRRLIPEEVRLLAGKHLFVYGVPEAANAVPERFLEGAMQAWPELVGPGFINAGLIPNPDDPNFPIGVPPVKSFNPAVNLAFQGKTRNAATCAMCHLGKLPDGRYVMGLPNPTLNSGRLALVFSYPIWSFDQNAKNPAAWDQRLIDQFTAMKDQAKQRGVAAAQLPDLSWVPEFLNISHFITLVASLPRLGKADQRDMLENTSGRGPAFYVALGTEEPLILSTPSLWGIESFPQRPYDLDKTRISSFFPAPDLETHMGEALYLNTGGHKKFAGVEFQVPLTDFVRALRPPKRLVAQEDDQVVMKGRALFQRRCAGCHSDDQGGSGKLIDANVMGLEAKYNAPYALDAKPSGPLAKKNFENIVEMMKEEHPEYDFSKRGVRPRRLKGSWALSYMMTTGTIRGLDHAFCLNGEIRKETEPSDESDAVHADLCNKYSIEERGALKAFLEQW